MIKTILIISLYKGKHILIMGKQIIFFMYMMIPFLLFAQKKKKEQYVFAQVSDLVIDADFNDWDGNLYNTTSDLWTFGIGIDKEHLYAAVVIKDKNLINEAVRNGVFLNISYSNKKKDGARLLFPRLNMEKLEDSLEEDEPKSNISNQEMINSAKGYYIAGFSKVVDGLLSFDNQYGIHASCKIDSAGNMCYESKIPLELIKLNTKEIAVQLAVVTQYGQMKKMNSNRPVPNTRGYYGRGMTQGSSIKNPYSEIPDVWFTGILK